MSCRFCGQEIARGNNPAHRCVGSLKHHAERQAAGDARAAERDSLRLSNERQRQIDECPGHVWHFQNHEEDRCAFCPAVRAVFNERMDM